MQQGGPGLDLREHAFEAVEKDMTIVIFTRPTGEKGFMFQTQ